MLQFESITVTSAVSHTTYSYGYSHSKQTHIWYISKILYTKMFDKMSYAYANSASLDQTAPYEAV